MIFRIEISPKKAHPGVEKPPPPLKKLRGLVHLSKKGVQKPGPRTCKNLKFKISLH